MERFSRFVDLSSQELAADESFQSYVFQKNTDDLSFWRDFIALHPEKQAEIDEAIEILTLLTFKKNRNTEAFKETALNRLFASISASDRGKRIYLNLRDPEERRRQISIPRLFASRWSRLAASTTGLLMILGAAFLLMIEFRDQGSVVYETRYGENSTIQLPDSSIVTLNGNTRLTLHEDWSGDAAREVWLDGEAFFEVENKGSSGDARFIVHTPGMDVEVLGTKFNVFNRDDKANVVLTSGKVEVRIASESDTSSVVMMPDEAVEFLRNDHTITKKQVKADVLTSWRKKILVFENTPLYQIAEMIEYTYGVKVVFRKNVNANEALAGTIPSENLEVLLNVLAKSSNLNITRNENRIVIEKMDPVSTEPQPK